MDLSNLDPALKIASILGAGVGAAITAFFVAPKNVSDLGLNRLLRRKHLSELIDALTSHKDGQEKVHPLAIQVKFQAAFGGARAYIPQGSEIIALLENRKLAEYSNVVDYAECSKFVAYSERSKAFIPREGRTDAELENKRRWNFIFYLLTATPAFGLLCIPPFSLKTLPFRILLSYLFTLVALVNAIESKLIGRTQKLLERTRAKTEKGTITPEHGVSVEELGPSKP